MEVQATVEVMGVADPMSMLEVVVQWVDQVVHVDEVA